MAINRDRPAGAIDVRFGAHYGLKSDIAPSPLGPISDISLSQFESSVGAAISGAQMIDGLSRITTSGIAAG